MSEIAVAFGLTLFAGLATGIGSAIAFFAKRTNFRFLSISTGFSAGVMLYVSFVEILFKGSEALTEVYGDHWGAWINVGAFFGGIILIGLIDAFIPQAENPHEVRSERTVAPLHNSDAPSVLPKEYHDHKLMRMGLFTALAIGIHNFPEGLATFLAALHDPSVGIVIAVAIALHNIPEGISVSVPIFYATGDRKKAFFYSFLSGLAEPIGALIAYGGIVLFTGGSGGAVSQEVMGVLFAGVAGIMVYISLDELIPTSNAYGKGHDSMIGLVGGMAVMALSLLMMR
ncbi:MAG: zinc transporter ZupT [Synergistales bacterium]|nr:zinc transporter ZupT [Dethiosulfovibrio sp.]NCC96631.1 zinc transporter ZupT [Synergistales bacterium]